MGTEVGSGTQSTGKFGNEVGNRTERTWVIKWRVRQREHGY